MTGQPVELAARALAAGMTVDEQRDLVGWPGGQVGLHDYAALYAVQGLYEAVYVQVLGGGSPALLAKVLAEVVPAVARPARRVLDVGAGTGLVGAALQGVGFADIAGVDIEPAALTALRRDRPGVYAQGRTLDLTYLSAADSAWLAAVAPDIVTAAGAVGYGHLPAEAFAVLTGLLAPGGLLALTASPGLLGDPGAGGDPELAGHAAVLLGPSYELLARRDGVHRRSASGDLPVTALVLRRTP